MAGTPTMTEQNQNFNFTQEFHRMNAELATVKTMLRDHLAQDGVNKKRITDKLDRSDAKMERVSETLARIDERLPARVADEEDLEEVKTTVRNHDKKLAVYTAIVGFVVYVLQFTTNWFKG